MVWTIKKREDCTYERNPLVSVICQLRFHPILKVADQISEFQESVRGTFPAFSSHTVSVVNLQTAAGPLDVQQEQQYRFKKADDSSTLTLTTSSLALENHQHIDRKDFFKDLVVSINALQALYAPIDPIRLGLRYINEIRKDVIEGQMQEKMEWRDLVTEQFLAMPLGLADLQNTTFVSEIRCPVANAQGALTLRHGLVNGPDGQPLYRFDMDRYFEMAFKLETIEDKLNQAGEDIFSLFTELMGPTLEKWMSAATLPGVN